MCSNRLHMTCHLLRSYKCYFSSENDRRSVSAKTFETRLTEEHEMIQIKFAATKYNPSHLIIAYASSDKPAVREEPDTSRIALQTVHGMEGATLETQGANNAIQMVGHPES